VSLNGVVSCINRTLWGQFLREIWPLKKMTPKYNAASGIIAGELLKEAMDSIDNDEKRSAAHSVNEEGQEFSLAEECARLLRIGREDGVKSQGKSKKREDAREIEHREWLVWLKEDKVSELKYCTIGFTKEAKLSGGTANKRYHVYC
jgi:hypothetical protein